jgi:hypothetical protein
MSQSAQLALGPQNEIIEDEKKTEHGGREVQEPPDGAVDLNPVNATSVLNTVVNTINNKFECKSHDEAGRLGTAHLIPGSIDDGLPRHMYSFPGLSRMKFLVH